MVSPHSHRRPQPRPLQFASHGWPEAWDFLFASFCSLHSTSIDFDLSFLPPFQLTISLSEEAASHTLQSGGSLVPQSHYSPPSLPLLCVL